MKITKRDILICLLFLSACAIFFVLGLDFVRLTQNEVANRLYKGALSRGLACLPLIAIVILLKNGKIFYSHNRPLVKALLWCLPALVVVAVNFPFSALISGNARLTEFGLLPAFVLECLAIGAMEELIFRGLFQPMFLDAFKDKRYGTITAVAVNSALFGLWHLANLFSGAAIGPTLLQVCYSFLIGAMLSAVFIRVGNVIPCIILHAVFNFGGFIVPTLGSGPFQDAIFWTLTAVAGVLCTAHVVLYLFRIDKDKNKEQRERTEKE